MAVDVTEYLTTSTDLTKVADAIRAKGGTSEPLIYPDGFVTAISNIQTGGTPSEPPMESNINFYDYDGTLLYTWTLAELAGKTALPDLPTQPGLICQGWNWSLAALKATNRKMNVGATYITDDGKTRIYIHLEEGRTSPMLGVCPNGTVTVDWGDGTTPDTLTGTSTSTVQWTPTHNYAAPGDYVIKLTVVGQMSFYGHVATNADSAILRYAAAIDTRNQVYQSSVQKIEVGNGVTSAGDYAFSRCYSLTSVTIPNGVTSIGRYSFSYCKHLVSAVIPAGITSIPGCVFQSCSTMGCVAIPEGVTNIGNSAFSSCGNLKSVTIPDGVPIFDNNILSLCYSLTTVVIPDGVTKINSGAFQQDAALNSVVIPDGVVSIAGYAFSATSLTSIIIPSGVTSIGANAFSSCASARSIVIPDGVTSIGANAFSYCSSVTSIVIPNGVSIGDNAFRGCSGMRVYDFSKHTAVPALVSVNVFNGIASDCEIRVPAALVDEWKAATNWATYADYIVGVAA